MRIMLLFFIFINIFSISSAISNAAVQVFDVSQSGRR